MASLFTGTVEEYANLASFPLVGAADTIYIALDTNVLYRWDTGLTSYVELSPNIINSLVFNDANGFDGTISLVGSVATLTITTALTTGSVGFIGASGALTQDNSNFYWDNTNKRLGINTNAPTTAIDTFGSGIITRVNGTSTNNAFIGFASAGTNKWSVGNVQSDHRFRIYNEATTSELVSVLQTGEFGIGIANPTTKLHIDGGASALIANLDANVSVAKSISFRSDNSNRINIEVSGTESGSNAGADLFIRRYSDAGSLIDTPLFIKRSTGYIGINNTTPTAPLHITSTSVGLLAFLESNQSNTQIRFNNTSTSGRSYSIGSGGSISGGGNGFYIYDETASLPRLLINGSGNIGIGTINTGAIAAGYTSITTNGVNGGGLIMQVNGTATGYIYNETGALYITNTSGNIIVSNAGSERLRILSTGQIGIGTSTVDSTISVDIQNASPSSNNVFLRIKNNAASEDCGIKIAGIYGTAYEHTIGVNTIIPSGDMFFSNSNTLGYRWNIDGSDKMRLLAGGALLINTTSVVGSDSRLNVHGPGSGPTFSNDTSAQQTLLVWNKGTSGDNLWVEFHVGTSLGTKGSIDYNRASNVTRYNTTSDANLKNIIGDSDKQKSIDILNSTRLREYSWKDDKTNKSQIGVIAQELYQTFKGAVTVGSDEELLGMEEYKNWGVDKTAFTFHLIAGWQKHNEIIANLEAKIKQLESK